MKTKLTLTIDADLVPRAKAHAAARGVSLSALVEAALRAQADPTQSSIVDRWVGRFELADRTDDPRFQALVAKYLAPGT